MLAVTALCACEAESPREPTLPPTAATPAEATAVPEKTPVPPDQPAGAANDGDDEQCGADKLGRWLNVLPTKTVKTEIAATVGERPIRYYTQGDPITMDFNPARLNVELGVDGRIKVFRCG